MQEPTTTMKLRGRPIAPVEALEAVQRLINSIYDAGETARISIPANPNDDDVLAIDYVIQSANHFEALTKSPNAVAFCAFLDSPEVIDILGRSCFRLASFAHVMRNDGHTIPTRAEDEQSYVLRWMLKKAIVYGADWKIGAEIELRAMRDRSQASRQAAAIEKAKAAANG